MHKSGFTVIELLIVIAIIAILTGVVLGSLRDARDGGIEAKIKSEMVLLAKRASVEETSAVTFDIVCGSNGLPQSSVISGIITSIERFSPDTVVCNSDTEMYALSAALSSTTYWCVDSLGFSKYIGAHLSSTTPDFACP